MRQIVIATTTVPAVIALLALGGCAIERDDQVATATEALESTEALDWSAALLAVPLAEAAEGTAEAMALGAADAASSTFSPAACVVVTTTGPTVVYDFDGCVGPRGLVALEGSLSVTYSVSREGVEISAVSEGLSVNDVDIAITMTGLVPAGSADRLDAEVEVLVSGPRGGEVTLSGALTFVADESCVALDGALDLGGGARSASLSVSGYERCDGSCPEAGGEVVAAAGGPRGEAEVRISFDGTDQASWSGSRGRSGVLPLACSAD